MPNLRLGLSVKVGNRHGPIQQNRLHELVKPVAKKPYGKGKACNGRPSAACLRGRHANCFSTTCGCQCHA